jgi:hypothetical protein
VLSVQAGNILEGIIKKVTPVVDSVWTRVYSGLFTITSSSRLGIESTSLFTKEIFNIALWLIGYNKPSDFCGPER